MHVLAANFPPAPPPAAETNSRGRTPDSEADRLQSHLVETWNHTFGTLPGDKCSQVFPGRLLDLLGALAERTELRLPPGLCLRNASASATPRVAGHAAGTTAEGVDEDGGDGSCPPSADGALAGCRLVDREMGGVSGKLPTGATQSSFIRPTPR